MPTPIDDLGIKAFNWNAHKDIMSDMMLTGNGNFSFVIKMNCGVITDYIMFKNFDIEDLLYESRCANVPQVVRVTSQES
jgi:hypothetical protein